ncbi:hypothetical protein RP20_CCG014916 [Aedes albopictus]|nr:hypothetical protein RP20_CCG014916 [Aedes albopictus]
MSSAPETGQTDLETMEVDTVSAEFGGPSTQEWTVVPKIDETSIELLSKPPIERLIDDSPSVSKLLFFVTTCQHVTQVTRFYLSPLSSSTLQIHRNSGSARFEGGKAAQGGTDAAGKERLPGHVDGFAEEQ